MPDIALSIVCPIYNSEAFIPSLLQSILRAANDEKLEFIFVDDQSTDASLAACKDGLAQLGKHIRCSYQILSHPFNRGVAAARNTGIKACSGRYIGFIDADDLFLPGFSDYLMPEITSAIPGPAAEILEFSYTEFNHNDEVLTHQTIPGAAKFATYSGNQRYKTLFKFGFFSWSRVYRRSLFDHVLFKEDGRAYEDVGFTMAMFCWANEIRRIDKALIGYRKHPASVTSTRDSRFFDQFSQLADTMPLARQRIGHSFGLELQYFVKLLIILIKGTRIKPTASRAEFYEQITRYRYGGNNELNGVTTLVARGCSYVIGRLMRLTLRFG